ncbi:hypothetical protein ES705_49569 [subsurface metagenome]
MRHLYNSKMTIQEVTRTSDGKGGWTEEWTDVSGLASIPCRINWLTGTLSRGEKVIDNKITWVRDAKIYLNYYSTITTEMRAVYDNKNYDIVDLSNPDEVGKYMVLMIKRSE